MIPYLLPLVEGAAFVAFLVVFTGFVWLLSRAQDWWRCRRQMRRFDAEVHWLDERRNRRGGDLWPPEVA